MLPKGLPAILYLPGSRTRALCMLLSMTVGVNAALLECLAGLLVGLELLLAGLGSELLQDGGAVGAGLDS